MRIQVIEQESTQIQNLKVDYIIVACGYESRSTYIASQVSASTAGKIAIRFPNENKNEHFFANAGFSFIEKNVFSAIDLKNQIMATMKGKKSDNSPINILIDYSSMTRTIYGEILHTFFSVREDVPVNLWFGYSVAKFHSYNKMTFNRNAEPIMGYASCDNDLPFAKGTALVIGLGCEENRCRGLIEFIDPAKKIFFLTDEAGDRRFYKEVLKTNKQVLSSVSEQSISTYHIYNFDELYFKLYTTCVALREEYRIILAPIGPKPFALASMLVSLNLRGCDVWRVSGGTFDTPLDAKANGKVVLVKVALRP